MDLLRNVFSIGTKSEKTFTYLGLNTTQNKSLDTMVEQSSFMSKIKLV